MNAPSSAEPVDRSGASSHQGIRLSVRGIGKSFAGNQVLSGINLDVFAGEVLAVLGENGAGKSTLSSIIAGLLLAGHRRHVVGRAALRAGFAAGCDGEWGLA